MPNHENNNSSANNSLGDKNLNPVKVICVTGGKGGVGKTNVSINLATALAANKQKVLLFDGDLSLSNVNVMLGLETEKNISNVLDGDCNLSDIILDGPSGVKIIPASSGIQKLAELSLPEHTGIITAFGELTHNFDVMIVDTAAGISHQVTSFSRASHDVIVVVCNEPTSITDAYALIKVMSQEYGLQRFRILANRVTNENDAQQVFRKLKTTADRFLDVTLQYFGAIPNDDHIQSAILQQQPVVNVYPNCKASIAFKKLGKKICALPAPEKAEGHITFFLERFIQSNTATINVEQEQIA